ncbi:hypothetical protein Angca_008985, partial [Angiostrongylus cantonensis]
GRHTCSGCSGLRRNEHPLRRARQKSASPNTSTATYTSGHCTAFQRFPFRAFMVISCAIEEMGTSGKKRIATKQKRTSVEMEQTEDLSDSGLSGAADKGRRDTSLLDVAKDESAVTVEQAGTSNNDYQEEFKVLGHSNFEPPKKINVTASWISTATLFPAELHSDNLAELSTVSGLPAPVAHLVQQKIKSWFPVQKAVLPALLKDITHVPLLRPRDIAISAPTGSGKTLCYVLPILTQVGPRPNGCLQALVIAPVQTLVKQIEKEFTTYNGCGAVITALSGATDFSKEQRHLAPDGVCMSNVIISTPGRLMDHLTDPSSGINLSTLRFLVVDEADRMGPMVRQEWLETVERRSGSLARCANLADIVASRWAPRKILLSATLSKDIEELHVWNLHQPRFFRASASADNEVCDRTKPRPRHLSHSGRGSTAVPMGSIPAPQACPAFHPSKYNVFQKILKNKILRCLCDQIYSFYTTYNVFLHRTKHITITCELVNENIHIVTYFFFFVQTRVLICSDVLSRGVDVDNIDCVVNYNLPKNDRLFVHRAGRTGRIGREGYVLSLADVFQRKIFVKNVLKKNGLWFNAQEVVLETYELEPHLARYRKALAHLK